VVLVLCCGGVGVAGVIYLRGGGDGHGTAASASASGTASASPGPSVSGTAWGSCAFTPGGQPAARAVTAPGPGSFSTRPAVAVLATNLGTIRITLAAAKAPCTVANLRSLAGQKYFDGTACHRVTTSGLYVLQCGDPTGTGTGGPGYQFADENLPGGSADPYPRGTVAMANAGPGTNGSQFFICQQDDKLPASYSVFGTVSDGMSIVDKVAAAGSDNSYGNGDGHPKLPVTITSFTVQYS
jgi:peptidyl-prolyl cis-trans isomerase B (cyclophilin B)